MSIYEGDIPYVVRGLQPICFWNVNIHEDNVKLIFSTHGNGLLPIERLPAQISEKNSRRDTLNGLKKAFIMI